MAGELTCSQPTYCDTEAEISAAVVAITLAAATDTVEVIPWKNGCLIFSITRAA